MSFQGARGQQLEVIVVVAVGPSLPADIELEFAHL